MPFIGVEFEIEHVEVARNLCGVHRLGNHDITEINMSVGRRAK
jgi:hypothetical protein